VRGRLGAPRQVALEVSGVVGVDAVGETGGGSTSLSE
jgi:hypothetical protein